MADGLGAARGTRSGRVSRAALQSILAVLLGGRLFDDVEDAWGTTILFVLVVLAISALTAELTSQAQRDGGSAARWTWTDTGVMVILGGLAGLLAAVSAFGNEASSTQTVATCFTALYLLLAGYFGFVRWRSLRGR